MYVINFIIIYDVVNLFSIKKYKSLRKLRVGVNRSTTTTAWCHIMAHASNWHKTEVKIFNNNGSLSPTLAYFCLTNKEVEMTTEII